MELIEAHWVSSMMLFLSVIGHAIWQDILAIIAKRHDLLNASC
jgi:hypothetical protein